MKTSDSIGPARQADTSRGFLLAASGYTLWGVFPLYFHWLRHVPATEVLAHRIIWSLVLLTAVSRLLPNRVTLAGLVRSLQTNTACLFSALFLACNWLVYIWAIGHQRAVEASLGYFINPLVSVLLAAVFLGERFNRYQQAAILLAACGVGILVFKTGELPWIAFILAFSFGTYGLIRKKYMVDARTGLTLETLLMTPFALLYLAWLWFSGELALFHIDRGTDALLLSAGAVTTLPLLLFLASMSGLRLSTIGLLQYIAPTLQFLVAVYLLHEPLSRGKLAAFMIIWMGLFVFALDILLKRKTQIRK